jgi:ATP-dependent DNA helicase RecG
MLPLRPDSPVQYLKGVGPQRAQWFEQASIRTVADLIEYFPFRYELETGQIDIADLQPRTTATVRGTVLRTRGGGRHGSVTAEIDDGTQVCTLRWFQGKYAPRGLCVGASVIATGEVQDYNDRREIVQPRVQVFPPDTAVNVPPRAARMVGVYRAAGKLSSRLVQQAVETVLAQPQIPAEESLPADLLKKHGFPARADAIRQMHSPRGDEELRRARERLAYEEFLLLELAMALRRQHIVVLQTGQKLHVTDEIDRRIRARFPFELTPSQNQVVREIAGDLTSGRPMTRLLQGDVGSGKTVVALYACLTAVANRKQAAIMAPTEILAEQHFRNIEQYLADSRVRYVLLRGGLPRAERAEILAKIERGQLDLVVGTQALIQEDVGFKDLAVVIVDEQHKFGVMQRARIRTKGPMPHYLVMTATPIPRTLAMTVFGDLDVSVIKHSPPGRGKIVTKVVTAAQWETVMTYVRGRLERGEQAFVVCPLIGKDAETGETDVTMAPESADKAARADLISVKQAHKRLVDGPWRGLETGLLHGSLKPAEKERVMREFAIGEQHALVATTVVEVGVDVPNATIMIVEHAERFGLSQLHQLRGRIARGKREALCVLVAYGPGAQAARRAAMADRGAQTARRAASAGHTSIVGPGASDNKAAKRLAIMAETTDGFRIAEADLRQRGPGELFGTRQHGLPELHVGNLVQDFGLLEKARQDAFDLIRRDPKLERPEHQALVPRLRRMFGGKLSLIDAA